MYALAGFFAPGNVGSSYAISPVCGLEWVRGGSGVVNAVSAIIISQQWCNNPKNPRRAVGYVQQGAPVALADPTWRRACVMAQSLALRRRRLARTCT